MSSLWSISLSFPTKIPYAALLSAYTSYMPHSISYFLI